MTKRTRTILLTIAVVISGAAGTALLTRAVSAQTISLPADVGDLSNASTVEVKDSTGAVVLSGHFIESPEDDDDIERKATLTGSGANAKATGEAEVEVSRGADNLLDQEVELTVSNLTPGATYVMFVDGKQLGTFQTNKNGKAEIELNTTPVR